MSRTVRAISPTDPGSRCWRWATIALAIGAIALLAAACDGSSEPGTTSSSQGLSSSIPSTPQTGAVAFAQCVRTNGVPAFPDPQNGHFLISGSVENNPKFKSAVQACQHLLSGGSTSNGGGGANTSAELAFARCMQTHGVANFPDPTAGGALGIPQGVDANSPQFQNAFKDCSQYLPNNGAGLGG